MRVRTFVKLQEAKRVTTDIVFKSGTTRLGKTVFQVCQEQHDEKVRFQKEKLKEERETYIKLKRLSDDMLATGKDYHKMTNEELKTVLRPFKRSSDGPMPTKKQGLLNIFNEWTHRPEPSFVIDAVTDNTGIIINAKANNFPNTVPIMMM